ncbi:uncharacterized protein K441DRAFT_699516 [Cenococcum geophilum 1.58]|uniref:uncharacterized protein n=1 Tax=Cenococcum geophilum 1.58 TaxID=794803 RepID=UPI00358F7237|nr:hypothetical protein K441DRAFT_699516 [Cenococcum geophilum 1.58]
MNTKSKARPWISNKHHMLTDSLKPGWVPGPHNRGTLGLIFSCVITLSLCIWTTVHVNIEPENEINKTLDRVLKAIFGSEVEEPWVNEKLEAFLARKTVRKIGWSCIILIAPEGMMAIAAYERKAAYILRDKINKTIERVYPSNQACEHKCLVKVYHDLRPHACNSKLPGNSEIKGWDISLAYYAVMGGFVIPEAVYDTAKSEELVHDTAKRRNKKLTLTPHGVWEVAQWESEDGKGLKLLSTITAEEVRDKGNATTLTKGIVISQVLWIIVQVIGRTAARYPVTLLELHTVLHTFCAVSMYIIWWYKPLDIETSTTIPLNYERDKGLVSCLVRGTTTLDPTDPLTVFENPPGGKTTKSTSDQSPSTHHADPKSPDIEKASPPTVGEVITSGQDSMASRAYPTSLDIEKASSPTVNEANTSSQDRPTSRAYLTSRSGLGKLMYQSLFNLHGRSQEGYYFEVIDDAYKRLSDARGNLWAQALIISFIGLTFGGVHLAAWNNSFPSYAEQLLWKISAAITAATWCSFTLSLSLYPSLKWLEKHNPVFETLIQWTFRVSFGVGLIPVLFARLYLLAESFASIRRVPLGSYEIPGWSNAWPHAS